jgi:uncharacterized protein YegP (UPF0339 family)
MASKNTARHDKIYVYLDVNKKYRWRRVSANGTEVHASTQGYKALIDCMKNLDRSFKKPKVIIQTFKKC